MGIKTILFKTKLNYRAYVQEYVTKPTIVPFTLTLYVAEPVPPYCAGGTGTQPENTRLPNPPLDTVVLLGNVNDAGAVSRDMGLNAVLVNVATLLYGLFILKVE